MFTPCLPLTSVSLHNPVERYTLRAKNTLSAIRHHKRVPRTTAWVYLFLLPGTSFSFRLKSFFLACISLALFLQGASQFSIHTVLPMGVHGIAYGDTLMNTSTVLKRAGIRKVTYQEKSPTAARGFSPITKYIDTAGRITAALSCLRSPKRDTSFCLPDTFSYDTKGRMVESRFRDAKGALYMKCTTEYGSDGTVKQTWTTWQPQKEVPDAEVSYRYYNDKGQLVRVEHEGKSSAFSNASLYYNEDGLLDSIRHDNAAYGTYVFTRKHKRNKEIALETATTRFEWTYNALGQCISSGWVLKQKMVRGRSTGSRALGMVRVNYYYNPDGTLSKVAEKRDGKESSLIVYSYEQ